MSELERQQPALFRRRRFEAPHRRRHPLRRLARPFAAALAMVGVPAALAWWVATSPQFAIGAIDVVASPRVPAAWIGARLDGLRGRHLLAVRLDEIEGRLADHPWIADLVVRRQLPGRLAVAVIERRPAALWRDGDRLIILDAAGAPIAPLGAEAGALDLPVLSAAGAGTDPGPVPAAAAAAIRLAAEWQRLSPGDRVSQVEILAAGDYRLVTERLPFTVVVSADRLRAGRAALTRVLSWIESDRLRALPAERVAAVDLRFSRQIVFQPAAAPPREEG